MDSSNQYDRCNRCDGKGEYPVRFGVPGSSPGFVPGEIVEEGTTKGGAAYNIRKGSGYVNQGTFLTEKEWVKCEPCLGTGWKKPRKEWPERGVFAVHSTKTDTMNFDEIFEKLQLVATNQGEEPPDETEQP